MNKRVLMMLIGLATGFDTAGYSQSNKSEACVFKKDKKDKKANFNFIKSHSVDGVTENQKVEYSYFLSKNTLYRIQVCSDENGSLKKKDIKIELFDYKRALVASTDKSPLLDVQIQKAGIYYIQFSLKSSYVSRITSTIHFARLMNSN